MDDLARMRSPVLSALLDQTSLDVLIPLGSLEQHGPHLPLSTDTIIADALVRAVAARVRDIVVAPGLVMGVSPHHLGYAGTVSLPESVVSGYVTGTVVSLLEHGFRYAYVVSGHAGNMPAMASGLAALPAALHPRATAYTDWPAQRAAMHRWAQTNLGLEPSAVGSHAGHFETSLLLHIAPELVDMDAARPGHTGPVEAAASRMIADGIRAVSPIGVLGDPTGATAAAGRGYLEVLTGLVQAWLEEHRRSAVCRP